MKDVLILGLMALGIFILIAASLIWGIARYDECRSHGFSFMYCTTK